MWRKEPKKVIYPTQLKPNLFFKNTKEKNDVVNIEFEKPVFLQNAP